MPGFALFWGSTFMLITFRARRPAGRVAALIAATALLSLGLVVTHPSAAQADPVVLQPGELVVDGGAESTIALGVAWIGHGQRKVNHLFGGPGRAIVNSSGATGETYAGGNMVFTWPTGGSGDTKTLTQTIDLSPSAAAISNGSVTALFSSFVGGTADQEANASVTFEFQDSLGAVVSTTTFGPVSAADRGNTTGLVPFSDSLLLPSDTRSVLITMTFERVGTQQGAYVDNVSLILDAPSPAAAPDSPTTEPGSPVTIDPAANDTPGAGATIVPGSLRLLDGGGAEVTNLTTPEGDFVVDTATGIVTFTPANGFVGSTPPVTYRITDTSGQQGEGTFTVNVAVLSGGLAVTGADSDGLISAGALLMLTGVGLVWLTQKRRRNA